MVLLGDDIDEGALGGDGFFDPNGDLGVAHDRSENGGKSGGRLENAHHVFTVGENAFDAGLT